jgi:AcrR family transcriptional regulator
MAEQRKKNEDALLLALACGATVEAAAKQCQLSDRTIYRRLKDADFKARLQAVRNDMVGRSAGLLTAAASEAVRTLLASQKDSAPPAVRLGAARAVLEVGMKLREVVDLQTRMEELEAMLEDLKKQQPANTWN